MRTKVLTPDCPTCEHMIVNSSNQFQCNWGESKTPKILKEHKGKKPHFCKLTMAMFERR